MNRTTRKSRLLVLLLAGVLALSAFVGCDSDKSTETETEGSGSTDAAVSEEETDPVEIALDAIEGTADWGGKDFGILYADDIAGYTEEVEAEKKVSDGTASEVINDAVYERNILFEQMCHLNFVLIPTGYASITDKVNAEVQSVTGDFYLVTQTTDRTASAATSNLLYDYLSLNINYDQEWWDPGTLEFALNGKVFFMNGPFNIVDDDVTFVMMFNKQLREDTQIPNLYQTVKNNEWTMEYFNSVISSLSKDDGSGSWDERDTYGLATPGSIGKTLFYGAGLQYVKNNRDMDSPELMLDNAKMQRALDVLTLARSIAQDNHASYVAEQGDESLAKDIFISGRSLFYCEAASYLRALNSNMKTEYGVIPIPKYSTDQEHYTTWSSDIGSTLSMPTTVGSLDVETFARVLETYVLLSQKYVRPAYYDTMLTSRNVRDAESAEMVDLIFQHRIYDMAMYFETIGLKDVFSDSVVGVDKFSSSYKTATSHFDMKMDRLLSKI